MTVTVGTATLRDVLHVCEHMRQSDWAEVINLLPQSVTTPEQIAMITMQVSRLVLCAKVDGVPTIIFQVSEILNGTFRAGLYGTDQFKIAGMAMVAEIIGGAIPYLLDDLGAVYCDAYSDTLHAEAHKLLEFIGFAKRAILPEYGSHGRDIALYVLTKGEANVLRNGRRWRRFQHPATDTAGSGGNPDPEGLPQDKGQPAQPL